MAGLSGNSRSWLSNKEPLSRLSCNMADDYEVREWWLVRHAPVKAKGLIYGHLDLEADFSDSNRLDALADFLPRGVAVLTSDLARCRDTALQVLGRQGCVKPSLIERSTLREQYFGCWEGKTYQEVEAEDEAHYRSFLESPAACAPDGGESFQELTKRVEAEMEALLQSVTAQNLILFTHAGVIRAMVGLALDITPEKMLSLAIDPLSLTHLTSFRKNSEISWRVHFVNDMPRV